MDIDILSKALSEKDKRHIKARENFLLSNRAWLLDNEKAVKAIKKQIVCIEKDIEKIKELAVSRYQDNCEHIIRGKVMENNRAFLACQNCGKEL
jgi:hypothetical protein